MKISKKTKFMAVDILFLAAAVLPVILAIILYVLTTPYSDGVNITGARIFFTIEMPLQDLPVTESQVNSVAVLTSIFFLCLYLTHGINAKSPTKRQHIAEIIVQKTEAMVHENMGSYFSGFAPFIAAVMALSVFSSLLSLFGLFPPTSDLNVVAGWSILVFALITYYKCKCGPAHYLKSFTKPIAVMTPMNVISEFATPLSMAFRHYGNVLSGMVISALVAAGLQGLSSLLFGRLPGVLGEFPLLQIGVPAVLSVYFDVFSGCLQAFIFAMLTMLYVSGGFPAEDFEKMKIRREQKKKNKKIKKAVKTI